MSEPHEMTAAKLSAAYASKDLSPVEVAEALLGRIEALDAEVNSFCLIDRAATLAQDIPDLLSECARGEADHWK